LLRNDAAPTAAEAGSFLASARRPATRRVAHATVRWAAKRPLAGVACGERVARVLHAREPS